MRAGREIAVWALVLAAAILILRGGFDALWLDRLRMGVAAAAAGVGLAGLYRLEQGLVRNRLDGLPLLVACGVGLAAAWSARSDLAGLPLARLAEILGLALLLPLPAAGRVWHRSGAWFGQAGVRRVVIALLGTILALSLPVTLAVVRDWPAGIITLAALTIRLLAPVPAAVVVLGGAITRLLLP